MSTDQNEEPVYWPRVKQILEDIMERWTTKWGRDAYPGIHEYYWETAKDFQESVLSGFRSIEPGVPGRETHLVKSLARGCGAFGRMPLRGPFVKKDQIEEIIRWIDSGMPEGPE